MRARKLDNGLTFSTKQIHQLRAVTKQTSALHFNPIP